MAGGGEAGRRMAAALAAAPVAVALAVAAMAAMQAGGPRSCIQNYPPPYPGHEEEVRAIVATGGEPGQIGSLDEYIKYFLDNSREGPTWR